MDDGRRSRRRRTEIGMVRESESAREGERNADGRGREGGRRTRNLPSKCHGSRAAAERRMRVERSFVMHVLMYSSGQPKEIFRVSAEMQKEG